MRKKAYIHETDTFCNITVLLYVAVGVVSPCKWLTCACICAVCTLDVAAAVLTVPRLLRDEAEKNRPHVGRTRSIKHSWNCLTAVAAKVFYRAAAPNKLRNLCMTGSTHCTHNKATIAKSGG